MQIAIKINEKAYKEILEDVERYRKRGMIVPYLYEVIASGTPLMNPQPKTGHWIKIHNPAYSPFDGSEPNKYICSECGCREKHKRNWCGDCGAKMIEPQESEEQK